MQRPCPPGDDDRRHAGGVGDVAPVAGGVEAAVVGYEELANGGVADDDSKRQRE